jgi:protein ImuB
MSAFSANRRRILSLWLPRLPIDRIKRLLSAGSAARGKDEPSIVVAKENNALAIHALDEAATRLGLHIGLPLANARAICPELKVFDADVAADAKTLGDIADWCDRFTPLVALDPPHGLFLDITGCAHLFGGEAALLQTLIRALAGQGFAVSAAIAGTSVCARTLTRPSPRGCVAQASRPSAMSPCAPRTRSRRASARGSPRCSRMRWGRAMRRSIRASRCPITSWRSALPSRSRPTP